MGRRDTIDTDFPIEDLKTPLPVSDGPDVLVIGEARRMLAVYAHTGGLAACLDLLGRHFAVIQSRTQLLLTLATLTLTITGFSGPKIAESGAFARCSLALGLSLVMISLVILLVGSLRIRWVTQFSGEDSIDYLSRIIRYRNRKTRLYTAELTILVVGLTCYVSSVVAFLLTGL